MVGESQNIFFEIDVTSYVHCLVFTGIVAWTRLVFCAERVSTTAFTQNTIIR